MEGMVKGGGASPGTELFSSVGPLHPLSTRLLPALDPSGLVNGLL